MPSFRIVLLATSISNESGWGRFTQEFCWALYRKGIEFELHLPAHQGISMRLPFAQNNRCDLPPPHIAIGKRWYRVPKMWWASHHISVKGDLIHSLIEFPYGIIAYQLARRYNLSFGITVHGTYAVDPLNRFPDKYLYRIAVKNANFIVAVSNFTGQRLLTRLGTKLPLAIIPDGVNFSYFSSKKHNSKQTVEKVVLCVGALKSRKGIDTLLKAFAKVIQEESTARLIIVGSGNKIPYIQMAEMLGISRNVSFLGSVSDEQLLDLYKRCDIFALLPREDENGHFEGFGLVYLEANACGKPVVGTYSGGVPDAVLDGVTGLLVPPDDPESASKAILKLIQDEELRQKMGESGIEWARKHDWSKVIEQYLQVYKTVLSKNED